MARLRSCVAAAVFTMASLPVWGQNFVTGPNTGAESRLDNTPRNVIFPLTVTGSGTYSFAGGVFYMKDGPSTTGNVTLTIYNSVSVPIGSVTLTNSTFCGGPNTPACQTYFYHTFTLPSPLTLSPGSYSLVLSTNAVPQQNSAYFVKGGGTSFSVAATPVPPPPTPDLTVSKGASPASFAAGMPATYGIQITNVGNGASSGLITVTDTLDPNLIFGSAAGTNWSCSATGQVVTCTTSAAIAAGAAAPPITINVNVAPGAPTSVTNTVLVAGGGETNTSNDFFQLVSPVSAPDLTVSKTSTPATFIQGQSGAYTITANNIGSAPSFGTITVTDTLGPNQTYVSATGSGWSCSAVAQVVTCTTSTAIAAGTSAPPITLTVNVAANGEISATNFVSIAGGGGANPTNNSFQLVTPVSAPDLTVSKTATPANFTKGQNGVVYTITANNTGNASSSGLITVTDTLDPNLTYVNATGSGWSCSAAAHVVTCTTSAVIVAGANAPPITLTVNVAANAPTSVTNKVTVAGGGETNTSNDSFQLVSVANAPDLTVSKTATPVSFIQGQNGALYTITASNIGSVASSGAITVTDTLDPNLIYVGATGSGWSCSAVAQVVTCTTSTAIAAGASGAPITLTVNVAAHGQTSVTNAVSVAGGSDANPTNNSFQLVSPVGASDLSVSKTSTPVTFTPGQNGVVYTITASNAGNASSSGTITVTDTLDPNLTYVTATGSGWSCSAAGQIVTCTTSTAIAAGAAAMPITLTVNVGANPGPTVTNKVTVSGGGETNTSNNSFQLVSNVVAPDLTVSKALNTGALRSGQVGAVYTVTASNIGNAPTSGLITVTDPLDPNLTYVSATGSGWSCSAAGQVVTCTTSTAIAAGASASPISITVNVAVSGSTPTSVTNKVTVAGGGETNTSNDSFQLVSVANAPDLTVSKTATPVSFIQGQNGALYTITASNIGSVASSGAITVTDTLDPNLIYVSATGSGWSCSAAAQVVTCTTSTAIAAGASGAPITLTVNVAAHGQTSVTNAVSVAGGSDANPTNNSFQLVSPVGASDLSVSKTATPVTFTPGQNGVVYTITASNVGNASTSGTITVTDTLDPNLTYVSATGSGWSCSAAAQVVTCTTSAVIVAGANAPPITLTVNVAANAPTSVTNKVTVAGGGETNTSNNSFQLVSNVSGGTNPPPTPVQGVPAISMPVLVLTGIVLIGIVVWLRRRAAYPG